MKLAVLFGGAGYIGSFLIQKLIAEKRFDKIVIYDIQDSGKYFDPENFRMLTYIIGDVKVPITIENLGAFDPKNSWIFNFAAIHREPGHEYKEYFNTNVPGAENINSFARKTGIRNIFFTSSIAPYGKSLNKNTEESSLYPETAYGISKALAEKIHREWLAEDVNRRLIIVRPSVIFGPKDPGNVYRMIKALKKGTFVLPNGGKVVKAYGYIYGLIESIIFTMNKSDRIIVYNYAENPLVLLNEMTDIVKKKFSYKKPVLSVSVKILSVVAAIIRGIYKIIGKSTDIHPVRVKKAGFPTNIEPRYLIDSGFKFKYDFESALKHWNEVSPDDFQQ
jgi:nucleoside-diphosphate-sugar epimerase